MIVTTASNDLCSCRKRGAWRTRAEAQRVLERITANPDQMTRTYLPTGVARCRTGIWHLTSKSGKPWKHGKRSRHHAR